MACWCRCMCRCHGCHSRQRGQRNMRKQRGQDNRLPGRKRVGLQPEGRAPLREHTEVIDADGNPVGEITSGGFGPTLGAPVAMGYVTAEHAATGTELSANLRGKQVKVTVVEMPMVPARYFRIKN